MSSSPPPDNAPAALDLDALEALASATKKQAQSPWGFGQFGWLTTGELGKANRRFINALDPDTVLELIRLARRLEQAFDYLQSCLLDASKTVPPEYDAFTIRRDWFASISENAFHIALGSPGEEGEPAE